jgi:hypothetical protein
MGIPAAPQLVLLLFLGGAFIHFMAAGGRTFSYAREAGDELGANLAMLNFLFGGTLSVWMLGLFYQRIPAANGASAAVLMAIALALYEWARHTIWAGDSASPGATRCPTRCAPRDLTAGCAIRSTCPT